MFIFQHYTFRDRGESRIKILSPFFIGGNYLVYNQGANKLIPILFLCIVVILFSSFHLAHVWAGCIASKFSVLSIAVGERRWILIGLACGGIVYFLLRHWLIIDGVAILKEIESQMLYSSLNLLPDDYWSLANVYKEFLVGIPRFFSGPAGLGVCFVF